MIFAGLTVLDLSDGPAGQYAARLFADYGADVLLVEPATGSKTRRAGTLTGAAASRASALFHHVNGGKRSATADAAGADRDAVLAHAAVADVVIVGEGRLADLLRESPGRAVIGILQEFADGPYGSWRGSELIHQALSGSMFVTGTADREPLYGFGNRVAYTAGTWLYLGLVAALIGRRRGAATSIVEISVHEAATAMEQNFATTWQYSGTIVRRGEEVRPRLRLECRDGWVVSFVPKGHWRRLCELLRAPELLTDPRFERWDSAVRNITAAAEAVQRYSRQLTVDELLAGAAELGMLLAPIATASTLRTEPHLVGRGYWSTTPDGRPALGPVFRPAGVLVDRARVAPPVGPPIDELTPPLAAGASDPRPESIDRPLEGISVIDMTVSWAGPSATKILAALGARVVKIESPGRVDQWRGEVVNPYLASVYPDNEPGVRSWNRNCWFNSQNHDKLSVILDLKREHARRIIDRLVPGVDLVVSNFSPGTVDRLGLDFARLTSINPRVSCVQMPAAGNDAPPLKQRGFGPTMEAMAGMTGYIGYEEDQIPLGSGSSYLDPVGGLNGAAAALTGLYHALVTGSGLDIEVSQQEAAMHWAGDVIIEDLEAGHDRRRTGNRRGTAWPHGAYPASGEDTWIAIACTSDNDWRILCAALDDPDLDPTWTLDERASRSGLIDEAVARWTRLRSAADGAARLQEAGLPAAPVLDGRGLTEDPQLRAVGWYARLVRDDLPDVDYPTSPLRLDGVRLTPRRLSPKFGQDTRQVLTEAGLAADEIDELFATGVTTSDPVVPA